VITAIDMHPADELASVRADIKTLEAREKHLRDALISHRERRVGAKFHAVVSERCRKSVGWEKLARKLGATAEQIAEHTTETVYSVVECTDIPSIAELVQLLSRPLTIIDVETTGLSPAQGDRMIQFAALPVHLEAGHVRTGSFMVGNSFVLTWNPERTSHPAAAAVHGLSEEFLASLAPMDEVDASLICKFLSGGKTVVAHNAPFDVGFIKSELTRFGINEIPGMQVIDTRVIAKILWPDEGGSLDPVAERLGIERTERASGTHDAMGDCHLLARVLPGLLAKLQERL
jgi:DNA polymerase-3 subunit epsilon